MPSLLTVAAFRSLVKQVWFSLTECLWDGCVETTASAGKFRHTSHTHTHTCAHIGFEERLVEQSSFLKQQSKMTNPNKRFAVIITFTFYAQFSLK